MRPSDVYIIWSRVMIFVKPDRRVLKRKLFIPPANRPTNQISYFPCPNRAVQVLGVGHCPRSNRIVDVAAIDRSIAAACEHFVSLLNLTVAAAAISPRPAVRFLCGGSGIIPPRRRQRCVFFLPLLNFYQRAQSRRHLFPLKAQTIN